MGDVAVGRAGADAPDLNLDDRVTAAVRLLRRGLSVDQALTATAVSSRQLRRLVLASAGLGPKALQWVLRLQRFVGLAERSAQINLAGLAFRSGYADQAHLRREVSNLTGHTPTELLRGARSGRLLQAIPLTGTAG